jgi:pimeloyl-ACP methyl ester carboxylesterase
MSLNKPLAFAGVVVLGTIIVGAIRVVSPGGTPGPATAEPGAVPITLDVINQAVQGAKQAGKEQGLEEAAAPPTLDSALASRGATLSAALELAGADTQNLVCARAAQYLKFASEQQATQALDVERWLLDQLAKENDLVKGLMATHGSMDGTAASATALDSPLRNRTAILAALNTLYTGDQPVGCRVAAFDSATQIDALLFAARRIKENQAQAVAKQPTPEVPHGQP